MTKRKRPRIHKPGNSVLTFTTDVQGVLDQIKRDPTTKEKLDNSFIEAFLFGRTTLRT